MSNREVQVEIISHKYPEHYGLIGAVQDIFLTPSGRIITVPIDTEKGIININVVTHGNGTFQEKLKHHIIEIGSKYYNEYHHLKSIQEPWTLVDMCPGC